MWLEFLFAILLCVLLEKSLSWRQSLRHTRPILTALAAERQRTGKASSRYRNEGRASSRGGEYIPQLASIRQNRVERMLRDELTEIICDTDVKANVYPDEGLLRGTTVSKVEVSADLMFAKIYVSVMGNAVEKRQVFVWLCENVGQVRFSLAKRLRHMRRVPELYFKLSESQAAADLVALIDELSPPSSPIDLEEFEEFEE